MKKIFLFLFAFLLTGCVSTNAYNEPVNTPNGVKLATVVSLYDTPDHFYICNLRAALLIGIDGKEVDYPMSGDAYKQKINLIPGKHLLIIKNTFTNSCIGDSTYIGYTKLEVNFKPGIDYRLNLNVDAHQAENWLESPDGKKMSKVVISPMHARVINVMTI